jgi:hypothetical protein
MSFEHPTPDGSRVPVERRALDLARESTAWLDSCLAALDAFAAELAVDDDETPAF